MLIKLRNISICLLLSICVGFTLLFLSYKIPTDNISKNVDKSADIIYSELLNNDKGNLFNWSHSVIDYYADSLILMNAANNVDETTFKKTLNVYMCDVVDNTVLEGTNLVDNLIAQYVNNVECISQKIYPRYWHGYLIFVKSLLYFFSISEIRMINFLIQFLLTSYVCYLLYKKGKTNFIIPYIIMYLMLNPIVNAYSFQFSSCFYVFTIGNITLLSVKKETLKKYNYLLFFIIGVSLAYFDLLTYVTSTIGIPLLIYIILNNDKDKRTLLKDLIRLSLYWLLGYSLMWASKWILASIFTDQNIIKNALQRIIYRTAGGLLPSTEHKISNYLLLLLYGNILNVSIFFKTPFVYLLILYISYFFISKIKHKHKFNWIYLIIFFLPFLWITVACEHSIQHASLFANKNFIVSTLALMFMVTDTKPSQIA